MGSWFYWLLASLILLQAPSGWATYYDYTDVLMVQNTNSSMSINVTSYFMSKRNVPAGNVLNVSCPADEEIDMATFVSCIKTPFETWMQANDAEFDINYIVTTKGVPLKITGTAGESCVGEWRASVDNTIALLNGSSSAWFNSSSWVLSDYHEQGVQFTHSAYPELRLVTRLDGYNYSEIVTMIDKVPTATDSGTFVLDVDPSWTDTYAFANQDIRDANTTLKNLGYTTVINDNDTWLSGQTNVLGYVSWGSNDAESTNNGKPGNTWKNGSIAETYVSTSARTFLSPPVYGQSLIADLIAEGANGAKGYVYEPCINAVADPDVLFQRYVSGFNFADSMYMASNHLGWMDVVVGDPKMVIVRPNISINLPVNSSTNSDVFNVTFLETVNASFYSLDGAANVSMGAVSSYQTTLTGMLDGQHNLSVWANVSDGRAHSETVYWNRVTIAFVAPTPALFSNKNWSYVNVSIDYPGNDTALLDWNRSLVGWWRFNEGTGTVAADSSSWGNNGTLKNMNAGIDNGTSGWTTSGKFGNGMKFDGVSSYMVASSGPVNNTFTVSVWGYDIEGDASGQNLIYKANEFIARTQPTILECYINSGGWVADTKTKSSELKVWNYYTCVYNGSAILAYVNGVSSGSPTTVGAIVGTTNDIIIGLNYFANYWNGTIDDVRIYNRALSPAEINASYNLGLYRLYNNFTGLVDGVYTYAAYSQDENGEIRSASSNLTIDDVDPAITSHQPPMNGSYSKVPLYFNGTCTDAVGVYNIYTNLSTYAENFTVSPFNFTNTSTLSDGIVDVMVTCSDEAGNVMSTYSQYYFDENAPNISFVDPTPTSGTWSRSAVVNVSMNDSVGLGSAFIDWNSSLIGWWRFDNSTDWLDHSGHRNNGTGAGGTSFNSRGKFGGGRQSTTYNQMIQVTKNDMPFVDELTLEGWVNNTAWPSDEDGHILEFYKSGGTGETYIQTGMYGSAFGVQTKGAWLYTGMDSQVLGFNTWHHIAGTFNKTDKKARLYVDGILMLTSSATTSALENAPNRITIGSDWFGDYSLIGVVDEVRLWNRALSPDEINASYNAGLYRLEHDFGGSSKGHVTFKAYAQDLTGNVQITEQRDIWYKPTLHVMNLKTGATLGGRSLLSMDEI